ncbi:hypothetical protein GQ651_16630 [Alphaproteobacteria bacterium GH1-50]|uniref:Uncharacterized protein n=1 Tax=Kangsaoukella pontilimi TaxID=2691042 RepID=A0A7C9MYV9_9RHOB|nr:hypothetical protein [Kangsaoukella pontilimi]MXQ09474.1 hypothetical protein [Kangsaoukella pontilimi]
MPLAVQLTTGTGSYANPTEALTDQLFGVRYISYRNVQRFLDQTEDTNVGLIVWPGGTLAEIRDDRFGFEFDGLQNPDNNKPALGDMMETALAQDASLSVVLPTARYVDDLSGLQADLSRFLETLLSGDLGHLPKELIFEVGSEYYAHFDGPYAASQYGAVADVMITEIAQALNDPSVNLIEADVTIAIQAGKTLEDDIQIRDALSDFSSAAVDTLIHHRFAYQPQGIDSRIDELELILDAWNEDTGTEVDLFVSAWNTVTLTRNGVLKDYLEYKASHGVDLDASDVDLQGRTTSEFEAYWQDTLDQAAYGQEHAAYILESFSSYAEAGADAAAHYGTDLIHPGRTSWSESGEAYDFVGAEMLEMIYESVDGTHVLSSDGDYDPKALATTYGFENEDKLIVFVAAGDRAPGEVNLEIANLGCVYKEVWAERLTGETPEDWMSIFGIADNAAVDESPEAETYAIGVREAFSPTATENGLSFSLDSPHEVIRLAFAKTEAGATEISSWSTGTPTELSEENPYDGLPLLPCADQAGALPMESHELESNAALLMVDAASGGSGIGLLLLLLMFL